MKVFLPEATPENRLLILQQNADEIEETTYFKTLTPDELDVKREQLTDNCISLSQFEDIKKDFLSDMKIKTDPLIKANKYLLIEIKNRHAEVKGRVFHMANYEAGYMESFNEAGELIASRRLRPDEKQPTIFNIQKQA